MSIIDRMREVLQGMSQGEVAELLGEKSSRVNSVLNGKQKVPEDFLVKFIEAFKVDANWLLLGVGEPPQPDLTSREAALLDNYRNSDETARRTLESTSALLAKPKAGSAKKAG